MAQNWSDSEVEAAVADYFRMLRLELTGIRYSKTEHRRALMRRLNKRTDGSVELKHQNISAVLIEMGVPYIEGYKPRFNYQRSLLPAAVEAYLRNDAELRLLLARDSVATPPVPTVEDFLTPTRMQQLMGAVVALNSSAVMAPAHRRRVSDDVRFKEIEQDRLEYADGCSPLVVEALFHRRSPIGVSSST